MPAPYRPLSLTIAMCLGGKCVQICMQVVVCQMKNGLPALTYSRVNRPRPKAWMSSLPRV
jgi:hypothetical protein